MKKDSLVYAFVLLLSITTVFASGEIPARKQSIRVMTYNIHHCNPPSEGEKIDVKAIAAVIINQKPDLVALQEVDVNTERSGKGNNQAKILAQLTGMYYYFSKAIDHQGGDYGVAVLSRFPIVDSIRFGLPIHVDKPEEQRTIAAITIELPGKKKLIFASTHLGLKEPNRLLQSEKIVTEFSNSKLPMILGGDFNATPESEVIKYLDRYFVRTCIADCGFTIPVDTPDKTIDFIMYKKGDPIRAKSTKVIDEKYASDHLPVISELEITF